MIFPSLNKSSGSAPPYSVARITGIDTLGNGFVYKFDKADKDCVLMDYKLGMGFTGPAATPKDSYGRINFTFPLRAAYTGSVPSAGNFLGIANGGWALTVSNYGFICVGDVDQDSSTCLIIPAPQMVKGKISGAVAKDTDGTTTGTLNLYDHSRTLISPACSVTVCSPMGALSSGKVCVAAWTHDEWTDVGTECS